MSDEYDKTQPQTFEQIQARHSQMLHETHRFLAWLADKYAVSTVEILGVLLILQTTQIVDQHVHAMSMSDDELDKGVMEEYEKFKTGEGFNPENN
jgi:hypothetical protein